MNPSIFLSKEAKDRILEAILTGAGTAIITTLAQYLINRAINHFDPPEQPEDDQEEEKSNE